MLLSCRSAPRVESRTTSPAKRARTRRGKGCRSNRGGGPWMAGLVVSGGSLASGAPGKVRVMPIGWQTSTSDLLAYSQTMPPERDLFANFERMRREMDELFGDVFDRTGLAPRKRGGFSPAVDVFYEGDPPRAVVQAELAGIDPDELTLEIDGRELVLAGHRRPDDAEGRVYQQLEIDFGPFRRV